MPLLAFTYPLDPVSFLVCGADEAGRGPLMGNVVAACVLLDPHRPVEGLNDSKKLTEKKREALEPVIKEQARAYGVGQCTPREIDSLNILHAALEAMRRAYMTMVQTLGRDCDLMLVDGNRIPPQLPLRAQAVVKGDAKVAEIAAASILAKVERDRQMYELDRQHPEYGFARHKGYPTKAHLELLRTLPLLPEYRLSYGPVRELAVERGILGGTDAH
ncbi:MAG: ribonuclease HII [Succinivibrio sp.]|nr:ribonuclease HII [Succinivibrio sp.]